jgi:hypothetical protein
MVAVEAPGGDPAYFFEPEGTREDAATVYTGGQTTRFDLTVRPIQVPDDDTHALVRDVVPAEWTVYDDGIDDIDRVEEGETDENAAVKYVYFTEDAPVNDDTTFTYVAEVPSGADETDVYSVGPAQVTSDNVAAVADESGWVDVDGTDDDVVVGADRNQ